MVLHGKSIQIKRYLSGATVPAVALSRDCQVKVDGEMIGSSSPTSGDWNEFVAGRKSWSVSIGWLVADNVAMMTEVCAKYSLLIVVDFGGYTLTFGGDALLKTCDVSAGVDGLAHGSIFFQGSGPLAPVVSSSDL